MSEREAIEQLYDLMNARKTFITGNDEGCEVFKKDLQALETIIATNKNLQKENNCLWERIKYLLTSRTVRMYDEVDPITKKHKFDISDLDNLQQRIDNALEWIDRTIEIIKMQPSEDDTWILERLNSFKLCLKGDSNE